MQKDFDKEKSIEDALNSLQGMQRMPADPAMYDKVMRRMANATDSTRKKQLILPRVAAAAVVLLLVNIASIIHFAKKESAPVQQQGISQVISEDISALSENNF